MWEESWQQGALGMSPNANTPPPFCRLPAQTCRQIITRAPLPPCGHPNSKADASAPGAMLKVPGG